MDCGLLRQWVRRLFTPARRPRPSASRSRPTFRPTVESLEIRLTPSVTFAAQQTFAAGNGPYAVAVADFNGDGRPDLVVANFNGGTVSVLLNTTPPGPPPRPSPPSRPSPSAAIPLAWRWRTSTATAGPTSPSPTATAQHGVGAAEHDAGRGHDRLLRRPADLRRRQHPATPWRWGTSTATAGPTSPSPTRQQHGVGAAEHDAGRGRHRSPSPPSRPSPSAPPHFRGGGGLQRRRPARPRRRQLRQQHGVGAAEHDGGRGHHRLLRRPADLRRRLRPRLRGGRRTSTATAGPTSPSPTTASKRCRCC